VENLQVYDLDGEPFLLGEQYGSSTPVVIIYLAASWCFTCGPEIAWLNEQATARPELAAYVVVLQNEDFETPQSEDGRRFRDGYDARIPVLVDTDRRFEPLLLSAAIPLNILVRTDRMEIMHRSEGFDSGLLDEAIQTVLEE